MRVDRRKYFPRSTGIEPMSDKRNPASVEETVPAAMCNHPQAARPFGDRSAQALPLQWRGTAGFTLAELLVSVGVLAVLVLLFTLLLKSTASITTLGHKQMDADSQARQLLDRMAIDFAQMVRRSDVDYYVKSSATPPPTGVRNPLQPGNDTIASYR